MGIELVCRDQQQSNRGRQIGKAQARHDKLHTAHAAKHAKQLGQRIKQEKEHHAGQPIFKIDRELR